MNPITVGQSQVLLLTPFNYYEWKSKMFLFLRSRGLFKIMMGTKVESTPNVEKLKWFNRCDKAYGLLYLFVSLDLLFHIESANSPNQIWTTLEGLFGKQDVLRGH